MTFTAKITGAKDLEKALRKLAKASDRGSIHIRPPCLLSAPKRASPKGVLRFGC